MGDSARLPTLPGLGSEGCVKAAARMANAVEKRGKVSLGGGPKPQGQFGVAFREPYRSTPAQTPSGRCSWELFSGTHERLAAIFSRQRIAAGDANDVDGDWVD